MAVNELEITPGRTIYFVVDGLGMPVSYGYPTRQQAEEAEELLDAGRDISPGVVVEKAMRLRPLTVYLDAAFDLGGAGHPAEAADVAAFEAAYRRAAHEVSRLSGVEITVEPDADGHRPADHLADDVWQSLHNCLERTRAGAWAVSGEAVKAVAAWLREHFGL